MNALAGTLTCKTCGLKFLWARELVRHIMEIRATGFAEADADDRR